MDTLLIKNGDIYDGTSRPWYKADVYVTNGKVAKVGKELKDKAGIVVDATGLAVAPGFWDLHVHDDWAIAMKNHPDLLECRIRTGITTLVGGNCGISPHPIIEKTLDDIKSYAAFLDTGISWSWRDLKGYLVYLEQQGIILNYATHFGQGSVRAAVMGMGATNPANERELQQMKELVATEMEQGAFGMSTGLLYPPGQFTPTDELIELARVVSGYGGLYLSHLRNEGELAFEALKEAITVGEKANLRVQISHHEMFGEKYFWKMKPTLDLMMEARNMRHVDISFDFIPYTGDNTTITAMFPGWAFEGGVSKLIERLKDPVQVARMREQAENYMPSWPPLEVYPHNINKASAADTKNKYDNILILWCNSDKNKELEGLTLAQLGKRVGKHPFEAAAELAAEEMGAVMVALFGGTGQPDFGWQNGDGEAKISYQALGKLEEVKHPFSTIESDAAVGKGRHSPAAWGTAPRVLGRYARDMGLITMEEAVRKLTFNPAGVLKVTDRGMIAEGNYADITIFDPKTIIDTATWKQERAPEGIEYVIVNGTVVLERGTYHKDRLAGQTIRSNPYYRHE